MLRNVFFSKALQIYIEPLNLVKMKYLLFGLLLVFFTISCQDEKRRDDKSPSKWALERKIVLPESDSLVHGSSYLPVYSEIFQQSDAKTYNLTITVSLRNVSLRDSIYLLTVDHYNSSGDIIKSYLENPVYVKPLETIDVVIEEMETEGGTGGNFIFDWAVVDERNPPLIESVMISTLGAQGISFTSRAVRVYK